MTIPGETFPSAILGNTNIYTSMYVPFYVYVISIQRQTHTLHGYTNTISYKRKIFQQKNIILQWLDWIEVSPGASTKTSPSLLENSKLGYNSNSLLIWKTLIGPSLTICKMYTMPLRV